mmetsp:Transcript_19417/g.44229  ORF Transcript_19417/g.44229 Transcript_19417/m.44229 type:complete len:214 (+) Transcript_19417:423-1064(+)
MFSGQDGSGADADVERPGRPGARGGESGGPGTDAVAFVGTRHQAAVQPEGVASVDDDQVGVPGFQSGVSVLRKTVRDGIFPALARVSLRGQTRRLLRRSIVEVHRDRPHLASRPVRGQRVVDVPFHNSPPRPSVGPRPLSLFPRRVFRTHPQGVPRRGNVNHPDPPRRRSTGDVAVEDAAEEDRIRTGARTGLRALGEGLLGLARVENLPEGA